MTDERERTQGTRSAGGAPAGAPGASGSAASAETGEQRLQAGTGVPAPSLELTAGAFKGSQPRPIFGPGLWVFGVLLWSYVVLGELVVDADLPEGIGLLVLLCCAGLAAGLSIHDSFEALPSDPAERSRRVWGPLGVALGMFVATVLVFAIIGRASSSEVDDEITLGMWALSWVPLMASRGMIRPGRPRRTGGRRALLWVGWIGAGLVTLVVMVRVVGEM